MVKKTFEVIACLFVLYLSGFAFVLLCYGMGGSGTDMMSEHYRSVLLLFAM